MAAKSLMIDFKQSQTIKRENVEKNMIFLGLLIVQNKLKEKTKESLEKFDNADLRMVMATGDNILTAVCVSKDCNLITKNQEMISCSIENFNGIDKLKWEKIDDDKNENMISPFDNKRELFPNDEYNKNETITVNNDKLKLNTKTTSTLYDLYPPEVINQMESGYKTKLKSVNKNNLLKDEDNNSVILSRTNSILSQKSKNSLTPKLMIEDKLPYSLCKDDTFGIAITGPTFERLFLLNEYYIKTKDELFKNAHETFRLILKNGRVFARMAPNHKALLVEALKNEGFITLMCGDGANDCSALRTSHVSISLSAEEASIAAHFTSKISDVSCVFELLREGKCSLCTSMMTFKFMMLYSFIEFFTIFLMLIYITYFTDLQFLLINIFLVFPLETFFAMQKPSAELTYHYVNSNLFSVPIMISVLTHAVIIFSFQLGGYKILNHYYDWNPQCGFDEDNVAYPCPTNTYLFLISLYQFFSMALSFFVTKPFKQRIYTNWPLMIYLFVFYFYFIWLTINCDEFSRNAFSIYNLEFKEVDHFTSETEGSQENKEELENKREENKEDPLASFRIPGGENIKYYIFMMAVINTVLNIVFERVIMRFVNKCYEERQIRKFRKEIEKEKMIKESNKDETKIKDIKIYKYQRVYYYNRRQKLKLLDY